MQTMSAPYAKAEILWDLGPLAMRRRMVEHSSIHWGRVGTHRVAATFRYPNLQKTNSYRTCYIKTRDC